MIYKAMVNDGESKSLVVEELKGVTSISKAKSIISNMYSATVQRIAYHNVYDWIIENTNSEKELWSVKVQNRILYMIEIVKADNSTIQKDVYELIEEIKEERYNKRIEKLTRDINKLEEVR